MHLTDAEYQVFKARYHCTAGSDEQNCVPVTVDNPSGETSWSAYVSGVQFHAAHVWLEQWRADGRPRAEAAPEAAQSPVRAHSHLHWMSWFADSLRAVFGRWAPRER